MERPRAQGTSKDTREVKISKNERDWLEYVSELISRDLTGDPSYGFRVSYNGDQKLSAGGKENMVRRLAQIVRRYDKAAKR